MEQETTPSKDTISRRSFLRRGLAVGGAGAIGAGLLANGLPAFAETGSGGLTQGDAAILRFLSDRKSTRLNSSHVAISYAVFCLKKKKQNNIKYSKKQGVKR